jgi:hypothetical protein
MTGSQQLLLAGGSAGNLSTGWSFAANNIGAGARTSSITFNPDGTITNSAGPNQPWFTPNTPGIGAQWWARCTLVTQANTNIAGNLGVSAFWLNLAAGGTISFSNTPSTARASGSVSVAFSPNNGGIIIPAGTITWAVGP